MPTVKNKHSVTLIELLLALVILSIMVLAFTAIDIFSRHQVLSSDRRIQAQNSASHVLEHMNKNIALAIGNEKINGSDTVIKTVASPMTVVAFVDSNLSGIRADPDSWVGYRLEGGTNNLRFCQSAASDGSCPAGWSSAILVSDKVTSFDVVKPVAGLYLNQNYISVTVTTCADPDGSPYACNTPSNPIAEMESRILMPSVSLN